MHKKGKISSFGKKTNHADYTTAVEYLGGYSKWDGNSPFPAHYCLFALLGSGPEEEKQALSLLGHYTKIKNNLDRPLNVEQYYFHFN